MLVTKFNEVHQCVGVLEHEVVLVKAKNLKDTRQQRGDSASLGAVSLEEGTFGMSKPPTSNDVSWPVLTIWVCCGRKQVGRLGQSLSIDATSWTSYKEHQPNRHKIVRPFPTIWNCVSEISTCSRYTRHT